MQRCGAGVSLHVHVNGASECDGPAHFSALLSHHGALRWFRAFGSRRRGARAVTARVAARCALAAACRGAAQRRVCTREGLVQATHVRACACSAGAAAARLVMADAVPPFGGGVGHDVSAPAPPYCTLPRQARPTREVHEQRRRCTSNDGGGSV